MEIKTSADMLAFIPYAINREPKNMLVVSAALRDAEPGQHAILAFALPEGPDPAFIKALAQGVGEVEPESAVCIVYTDEAGCEDGHPPLMDVASVVMLTFTMLLPGTSLRAMMTVGQDGWWELSDPETKRSLDEITNSVLNAEMVASGRTYRRGGVVIPEPTAASMTTFMKIEQKRLAIPSGLGRYGYLDSDSVHFTKARALLDTLMDAGHGPTPSQAVEMIAYLNCEVIRDRLVGDITSAPEDRKEYASHVMGRGDLPFSTSRINAGTALLTNLLQYATGKHRGPVLFCYSWLKWLTGDTEEAEAYFAAAGEADPDLDVPEVVGVGLRDGGIPPSATRRPVR